MTEPGPERTLGKTSKSIQKGLTGKYGGGLALGVEKNKETRAMYG